ncbi:MAG TPA: penicillin-binding protein 2, partial [Candidatus Methylomirabilis sp.]|nr:penicillin-binding protein 2 [Candidatus Methylomirabilis sp.]
GMITDRHGRELAVSLEAQSLYAHPGAVRAPRAAAAALAPILGQSRGEVLRRLTADKPFVWLQRKLPARQAEVLASLSLPGIGLLPETRRSYPRGELAAHLVGFVGLDDAGLEGVEYQYDALLGGGPRFVTGRVDALGRVLFRDEGPPRPAPVDLVLTVDEVIQYVAERELQRAVAKAQAQAGSVLVLDPGSGEVLALANVPTFSPDAFAEGSAPARRNRALADSYEPGSVFKMVLAAAALEEGLVRPEELFFGEHGVIEVAGVKIRDHEPYGWLTFSQVVARSSNVGAIKVGQRLGRSTYYSYLSGFGFGARTGVDLPGETPGLLRRPRQWSAVSIGALSIGQEVSVTSLQLVSALAAVANGGRLYQPHVLKAVRGEAGAATREIPPQVVRQVISPETARRLTAILVEAVERGTGKAAAVPGYTVAGKTGTAQKLDRETGLYSRSKVVASFAGFVPAESPRLAILVVLDEPAHDRWGGSAAGPAFREIAREVLGYLNVPPSPGRRIQVVRRADGTAQDLN